MRAKERKIRSKPSIAFANEASAKENIQVKIQALLHLLETKKSDSPAVRSAFLKTLPTSLRGFNGWASDKLEASARRSVGTFRSNSRIALHRSGLLANLEKAFAAVMAERVAVTSPSKREETVVGLTRKLKIEAQLRNISEQEIVQLKRKINELVDTCDDLRMQLSSANREASHLSARIKADRVPNSGNIVKLSSVAKKTKDRRK